LKGCRWSSNICAVQSLLEELLSLQEIQSF
jgi:hypothetical protein